MISNPAGASARETADACGRNVAGRPAAAGRCLLLPASLRRSTARCQQPPSTAAEPQPTVRLGGVSVA